jgi:hypothetical protein
MCHSDRSFEVFDVRPSMMRDEFIDLSTSFDGCNSGETETNTGKYGKEMLGDALFEDILKLVAKIGRKRVVAEELTSSRSTSSPRNHV